MLSHNALVVVADGHGATLYRNSGNGDVQLSEVRKLTPKNLADESASGPRPEDNSPKSEDEATFAKQLAVALNDIVLKHKADHVVIVADPETLGQMRRSYHAELKKRIVKEVPKTLTKNSGADVSAAVAAALK